MAAVFKARVRLAGTVIAASLGALTATSAVAATYGCDFNYADDDGTIRQHVVVTDRSPQSLVIRDTWYTAGHTVLADGTEALVLTIRDTAGDAQTTTAWEASFAGLTMDPVSRPDTLRESHCRLQGP